MRNTETKIPLQIVVANAKKEIREAVKKVGQDYCLPACIMETLLASVMAEVAADSETELINTTNLVMHEKNKELEDAKEAAKKVLPEDREDNR